MALVAKLLHPGAVLPAMGELRACEDVLVASGDGMRTGVRTGVSIVVPGGIRAYYLAVGSGDVGSGDVVSGEEIVIQTYNTSPAPHQILKGDHVADLVFRYTDAVADGDAAEMGPIA